MEPPTGIVCIADQNGRDLEIGCWSMEMKTLVLSARVLCVFVKSDFHLPLRLG